MNSYVSPANNKIVIVTVNLFVGRKHYVSKKMDKPNEGVKCVVNSCEYYMNGDHCAAERIQVNPETLRTLTRQIVQPFAPKDRTF